MSAEHLSAEVPSAEPRFWRAAKRETALQDYVAISAPITERDAITRAGDVLRVWRLEGVPFEAASPSLLAERHEAMCNLLRNLPGDQAAIYQHRIQRQVHDRLADPVAPRFSAEFSRAYQDRVGAKPLLSRELYLTLLIRHPDPGRRLLRGARSPEAIAQTQRELLAVLDEKSQMLERALRAFGPTVLGIEEVDGRAWWRAGELFSFLINGLWRPVPVPAAAAWKVLPDARLTFGGSRLEIRQGERRRYATMLDLKEFDAEVQPGTLSALLYERSEWVETQSFLTLPRRRALAALKVQRNQLSATDDVVRTQIDAMDEAMNHVGDGALAMGEYAYSLAVFGASPEEANQKAASAVGALAESSAMQLVPVDLVADAAWFAQQPGNFKWRTRRAILSSRAFAALACAHGFARGKRDGNPWGEALALLRTPSGQPYYLNLHASPADQDSEGQKLPGSTILVGQTGSGKTTLLAGLLALTAKWPQRPRLVSFSLYRDTEILIRALGGVVHRFERGRPTGLNPLQREEVPTAQRKAHWVALVKLCLASAELPLLPSDETVIAQAVETVARMPVHLRWFSTLRQSLTRDGRDSLYDRMGRWCRGGEYGWVFDEAPDALGDVRRHHAIGFDYTGVAELAEVRNPIMLELLAVMGELVNGEPLIYHVAEAWRALGDPIFSAFIKNGQKTIRKANGLGIFDTQEVGDLLAHENGRTMIEQSVTKLILPNPDASRADYLEGLGLTEAEFATVQRLGATGSRRFLCKQGLHSVECEFDLSGADELLTVLSSSLDNVELLDAIRAEVGDNPDVWLPILHQRVRQRRQLRRVA